MALIQSASGTRIDCDLCDDYAAAPSLSVEVLRRATGYVSTRPRLLFHVLGAVHDVEVRGRNARARWRRASRRVITVHESTA